MIYIDLTFNYKKHIKPRVIILGAGVSGLSLAWKLSSQGIQTEILEQNSYVGGLAGTVRKDGYFMDVGPHSLFSEHEEIIKTVTELFDPKLLPVQRRVKFYFKGAYLDYPLTPKNVLFQMGLWNGFLCLLSFLKSEFFPQKFNTPEGEDETVEHWAISSFGRRLYESFFKPYTEQFWKIPCSELAARSIPHHTRTSFLNTLRVLVGQKFTKKSGSLVEREKLPTYYPETGYGEISEKIANKVQESGGNIVLNSKVQGIIYTEGNGIQIEYEQGNEIRTIEGDYIVSTIPLHHFAKMLKPDSEEVLESLNKLDYRALVVLGMVTEKQDMLGCQYMYLMDRPYNRITELNGFHEKTSPPGENIIMAELPCHRGSEVWNASKEELFEMCIDSLTKDQVLKREEVKKLLVVKAPYAYPVYRKDYAKHLKTLLEFVNSQKGVSTLGRTGEFMYMDIDGCIKRAFELAEYLIDNFQSSETTK